MVPAHNDDNGAGSWAYVGRKRAVLSQMPRSGLTALASSAPRAPIMVFNLETNSSHVPLGLGSGKVLPSASGKTVYNFFIEPQFTILDQGPGSRSSRSTWAQRAVQIDRTG